MKKIAVINDISGFGRCSLTAAIPIISAQGIQCCPLPTGVYSNQTGYPSYASVDLTDSMSEFIGEWKKLGVSFDGILTGFIPNSRQGEIISDFIDEFKKENTLVVADPVMADDGALYDGFDDERISAVKRIANKADIITPNLTELYVLCNADYKKISKLGDAELLTEIESLSQSTGKTVVTTGIHLGNDEIANAVYDKKRFSVVKAKKYGGSFSGTGDILSSFITAGCVNGADILSAVQDATEFIEKSVLNTTKRNYRAEDGIDFEKELR